MLRSRNFLDVRLSASGIKKPSLKSCTVLLRKMLLQLRVIIGDLSCQRLETVGTPGRPRSNGQRQEACSTVMPTNLADCQMSAP